MAARAELQDEDAGGSASDSGEASADNWDDKVVLHTKKKQDAGAEPAAYIDLRRPVLHVLPTASDGLAQKLPISDACLSRRPSFTVVKTSMSRNLDMFHAYSIILQVHCPDQARRHPMQRRRRAYRKAAAETHSSAAMMTMKRRELNQAWRKPRQPPWKNCVRHQTQKDIQKSLTARSEPVVHRMILLRRQADHRRHLPPQVRCSLQAVSVVLLNSDWQ